MRRLDLHLAAVAILAATSAGAQTPAAKKPVKPAACTTPTAKTKWLKDQREVLTEGKWTDDTTRANVLGLAMMNPADSVSIQWGWQIQDSTKKPSSDMTNFLKTQAITRGAPFPTRSTVGVAGMRAVWVLSQQDTTLLRGALHRIMEAGPDEGIKSDIAILEDQMRLMNGRKQLYGTQLHWVGGKLAPFAIEDSSHVDLRRDAAALPPLAWSVCDAKSKSAR